MSGKTLIYLTLTCTLLAILWGPKLAKPNPTLLYNPSESAKIGWYGITPSDHYSVGDLVAAYLPEEAETLADARGYLPGGAPVIKTIGAVAGDTYCIRSSHLEIGADIRLPIHSLDRQGRAMPVEAERCAEISKDHVILISERTSWSFDSRYFGEIPMSDIIGRVRYLGPSVDENRSGLSDMGGARGLGADGKIKARSAKEALAHCLHIIFYGADIFARAPGFSNFSIDSMSLGGAKSRSILWRHLRTLP